MTGTALRELTLERSPFEITARDGAARAGVIHTPHGPVRTPAFVPLASTATVKSLHASEVAELGYDMVLGNTFHLFIQPGHELIARDGRAARVHGLAAADHHRLGRLPGVLDGPRLGGRGDQAPPRQAPVDGDLDRGGGRALPLLRGRDASASWARRPRWRSRPRSARTSRSRSTSARPSTWSATTPRARWSARTAGSTAASTWCREHAPDGPAALRHRAGRGVRGPARRVDAPTWPARAWTASRSAARSARRRSRCARWSAGRSPGFPTSRRGTCSGSATWTTSSTRWARGSTPSTARRPRASPATAPRWSTTPARAGASTSRRARTGPAASRSTRTAPARPAASTRAATCTT